MNRKARVLSGFVMLIFLMVISPSGLARAGYGVSPSKIEFNGEAGKTLSKSLTVFNTTKRDVNIDCEFLDFIIGQDGEPSAVGIEGGRLACKEWLSVEPAKARIQGGSKLDLNVTALIPEDAQKRGRAAYLRISLIPTGTQPGIAPKSALDALMLIDVSGAGVSTEGENKILDYEITVPIHKRLWLTGELPVAIKVNSSSAYTSDVKGCLVARQGAKEVSTMVLPERVIFPRSTRTITASLRPPRASGIVEVSLEDVYGHEPRSIKNAKVIRVPPSIFKTLILGFAGIILGGIYLIWMMNKHDRIEKER